MTRLNAEGHDETQYLPKGSPVVNAFRAAKGDVKLNSTEYRALTWMPHILESKELLQKEHVDTCMSWWQILMTARRVLGICDLRGVIADRNLGNPSANKEVDIFLAVINGLPKPEANMMFWVVDDNYNHGNVALGIKLIGTITHAIEHTQKIIVDCKRESDNM